MKKKTMKQRRLKMNTMTANAINYLTVAIVIIPIIITIVYKWVLS